METDVMFITDYASLGELNVALDKCGDDFLKLMQQVDGYLERVKQELEMKKRILEQRYQKAQQALAYAQEALSSCEASQEWDEEDRCYRPSCASEEREVRAAETEEYQARKTYEDACRIVDRADRAISNYQRYSMINPGPKQRLTNLAEGHTDAAAKELSSIIDDVAAYLSISQDAAGYNGGVESSGEDQDMRNDINDMIREEQVDEIGGNGIATPDHMQICSGCGLPITKCICGDLPKRDHVKSKADKFRDGMAAIKCPHCGKPLKNCECEMGPHERERAIIMDILQKQR